MCDVKLRDELVLCWTKAAVTSRGHSWSCITKHVVMVWTSWERTISWLGKSALLHGLRGWTKR